MRRMMRGVAVLAAAGLMVLAGACSDDVVEPPIPGMLLVSLGMTTTDDDGVLLKVTGPGIQSVGATNSVHEVFWRLASEGEAHVIVLGGLTGGPLVTVQVPDVRQATEYTATVMDVAARSDAVREQLSGYQATVARF